MVHCFVDLYREEIGLEDKWENPPLEDEVERHERIAYLMKK